MQSIKKLLFIFTFLFLALILNACNRQNNKADIVTTLYPQYDIAKQIVGDKMTVSLLTPFGGEIHGFDPRPSDIVAIKESKLFIFSSHELEPWVGNILDDSIYALDLSKSFTLAPHDHDHDHDDENHDEHDDDDHDHDHASLHYWTDPTTFMQLIRAIWASILVIDPANTAYYTARADAYYDEIRALHIELDIFMQALDHPTIYFAGHNANDAFAERYHLHIRSFSESFKPDAELTPQQLTSLINEISSLGVHYLFIEELVEPRAALAIQAELATRSHSLTLLELHGYHNITKQQNQEGVRYADLFAQNIANLRIALDH